MIAVYGRKNADKEPCSAQISMKYLNNKWNRTCCCSSAVLQMIMARVQLYPLLAFYSNVIVVSEVSSWSKTKPIHLVGMVDLFNKK